MNIIIFISLTHNALQGDARVKNIRQIESFTEINNKYSQVELNFAI